MLKIACLFIAFSVVAADIKPVKSGPMLVPSSDMPVPPPGPGPVPPPGAGPMPIAPGVRQVPPGAISAQHPQGLPKPIQMLDKDEVTADSKDVRKAPGTSDDMDKAETFGFGYHKHIYITPRYYGGYYGGYYPYYAHHVGYPYYY